MSMHTGPLVHRIPCIVIEHQDRYPPALRTTETANRIDQISTNLIMFRYTSASSFAAFSGEGTLLFSPPALPLKLPCLLLCLLSDIRLTKTKAPTTIPQNTVQS